MKPAEDGFYVEELEIQRMPGFRRQGFVLPGLGRGVNVVYGPNASGKTTAAKALIGLLWPETLAANSIVHASILLTGRPGSIEVADGRSRWQSPGMDLAPLPVNSESFSLYYISLVELLQQTEKGESFAQAIQREIAGGYDLDGAVSALGWVGNPPGSQGLPRQLREARGQVREARQEMQRLVKEEELLASLREQLAAAQRAGNQVEQLAAAKNVVEARYQLSVLQEQLDQYPQWWGQLLGNEEEELAAWQEERQRAEASQQQAQADLTAARQDLAAANLPAAGLSLAQRQLWQEQLADLEALEQTLAGWRQDLVRLEARQAAEAQRLQRVEEPERSPESVAPTEDGKTDTVFDPRRAVQVTGAHLDQLQAVADEGGGLEARRRDLDAQLTTVKAEIEALEKGWRASFAGEQAAAYGRDQSDGPAANTAVLRDGLSALGHWLRSAGQDAAEMTVSRGEKSPGKLSRWAYSLFALLFLAAGALLLRQGQGSMGGLLILAGLAAAGIAFWDWRARAAVSDAATAAAEARRYRQDYEALQSLPQPVAWAPAAVAEVMRKLQQALADGEQINSLQQRRRRLQHELTQLDENLQAVVRKRRRLAASLGLPAAAGLQATQWLAERLQTWQELTVDAAEKEAQLAAGQAQYEKQLAALAAELKPFGFDQLEGSAAVRAALAELEGRVEKARTAQAEITRAEETLARSQEQLQRLQAQQNTLLERLGMTAEDTAWRQQLSQALQQLPAYQNLREEVLASQRDVQRLVAAGEIAGVTPEMLEQPVEKLAEKLAAAQARVDERDELSRRVGAIESRLTAAKQGTRLAAALNEEGKAAEKVRQLFQDTAARRLGRLLAATVTAETEELERPAVFRRARELFADITRGQYSLELDVGGAEPVFWAQELGTGEARRLEHLSDGTRVQLFFAVRLAFIEQQEAGWQLPLVLDELLANSDDQRVQAVINAVLVLAHQGRQIFYFTAQGDEVAKWRALAAGQTDVSLQTIDLAQERRLQQAGETPALLVEGQVADLFATAQQPLPDPQGLDYETYGLELGVPALDPFSWADPQSPDGVHLWYLVDDNYTLQSLLDLGAATWGPLSNMAETSGQVGWSTDAKQAYRRAQAGARSLAALLQAWRVGRALPVDDQVLAASGAVSETFMAQVEDLAADLDGDGRRLLAALRNRQVARFREASIDQLEDYFTSHGYLDDRRRHSLSEVVQLALAHVQQEINDGWLNQEVVWRQALCLPGLVDDTGASGQAAPGRRQS